MESSRTPYLAASKGFSLVEMLVVLSIIGIVTTIALVGQSAFNRSLLLTDAAYSMALSLREAQTLGYSSRATGGTQSVQNAGYAAQFSSATPGSYVLFADTMPASPGSTMGGQCDGHTVTSGPEAKPGDCVYTALSDALIQTYTFSRGYRISQICASGTGASPPRYCSTDAVDSLSRVTVLYLRSHPDTIFMGYRNTTGWTKLTRVEVYLQSADGGATRGICVTRAGQVSITFGTCPAL